MVALGIQDLRRELHEWGRRFTRLPDDALFVAWFLRAYVTDEEQQAVDALAGGAGDKGVDAVLIDDKVRAVFLIQGKLRESLMKGAEKREDVLSFAQLAHTLHAEDDDWESYVTKLAPDTRDRLEGHESGSWSARIACIFASSQPGACQRLWSRKPGDGRDLRRHRRTTHQGSLHLMAGK